MAAMSNLRSKEKTGSTGPPGFGGRKHQMLDLIVEKSAHPNTDV